MRTYEELDDELERTAERLADYTLHLRHWRTLALNQEKLLVAYRLGRRPSGQVLDAIHKARVSIAELEGRDP